MFTESRGTETMKKITKENRVLFGDILLCVACGNIFGLIIGMIVSYFFSSDMGMAIGWCVNLFVTIIVAYIISGITGIEKITIKTFTNWS